MPVTKQDENLPPSLSQSQSYNPPKVPGTSGRKFGNSALNLDISSRPGTPRSGITKALMNLKTGGGGETEVGNDSGLLTPPASQPTSATLMLSPPPEIQLEEQRRTKALQLSAGNNKRPRPPHVPVPGSPTPVDTPNPRIKKHFRKDDNDYNEDTMPASPTPNLSKNFILKRTNSEQNLNSPERIPQSSMLGAFLTVGRASGLNSRSGSPTPSRSRSRTPVVRYSPPREQFTPPREVLSPAPTKALTTSKKIRVKKEEGVSMRSVRSKPKQPRASLPPPDLDTLDLTMPLPPASPSEDPILLKGKPSRSKLRHTTPSKKGKRKEVPREFTLHSNFENTHVDSPGLFSGVDDTFANHPRRQEGTSGGGRLSFTNLNQAEDDEAPIENPEWILSDPVRGSDMNLDVDMNGTAGSSRMVESHESARTFLPQEDDWNMDQYQQDGYFDAHVDHGFGSDSDNEVGPQDGEKEVIPSSDAEEDDEMVVGRGSQANSPVKRPSTPPPIKSTTPPRAKSATPLSAKTTTPVSVAFPRTEEKASLGPTIPSSDPMEIEEVFEEEIVDEEAPVFDEYEVPLATEESANNSLRDLRPGSPHPNKSSDSIAIMSEDEDDDGENDGNWTFQDGDKLIRRRTLSELEKYVDGVGKRRSSQSPSPIKATLALIAPKRQEVRHESTHDGWTEDTGASTIPSRSPAWDRTPAQKEIPAREEIHAEKVTSIMSEVVDLPRHISPALIAAQSSQQPMTAPAPVSFEVPELLEDVDPLPTHDFSMQFEQTTIVPSESLQKTIEEARARRDSLPERQFNMTIFQTPTRAADQSLPFIDLDAVSTPRPATPHILKLKKSNSNLFAPGPLQESPKIVEDSPLVMTTGDTSDESPEEIEVETDGLVKISSCDPWAAAKAAAILKQHHDYEEDVYRSRAHARRRLSQSPMQKQKQSLRLRDGISKHGSPSVLEQVRSPAALRELLHEAELSVTADSPRASSVVSERSASSIYAPSLLSIPSVADYVPVPGEWRKSDWKALDRCFTDERLLNGRNGLMADPDEVEPEVVVERYLNEIKDFADSLGYEWSTERLLRRVHALKDRQRQGRGAPPTPSTLRNIDPSLQIPMFTPTPSRNGMHHYRESSVPQTPVGRQLDFSNIPETPMTTPTLPPVFHSSRYKHLTKDSGFSLSKPLVNNERRKLEPPRVNIVPPSTPAPEASPPSMRFRERSVTVSPTRSISSSIPSVMWTPSGGVKNKVLNYVGSFFNRQQTPKTARYAVSGPSALPRPSEEDIGAIYPRGPVSTPPRPSIPLPVPPKDLVSLQHQEPPASKLPVFKKPKTPKRLIDLQHVPAPPGTAPRVKKKASTGSVRDIVKAFEEKDRERANAIHKRTTSSLGSVNTASHRLRATSSLGDMRGAFAGQNLLVPAMKTKPLDPTTRPRWRL